MWICPMKITIIIIIMESYLECIHLMNQLLLFKSTCSIWFLKKQYIIFLCSDLDDSRGFLYYAPSDTFVSPTEQNDLYGCLIEKKRVGVFTDKYQSRESPNSFLSNALLSCCHSITMCICRSLLIIFILFSMLVFVVLLLLHPHLIYLLEQVNYNVNHLYVIHVVIRVYNMFHRFIQQIFRPYEDKIHRLWKQRVRQI